MARLTYSFRGFVIPVFTPFNERTSSIDLSIIPAYAKYLVDRGIKGVLVNGSTGEGPSMSVAERKSVATAWAEAAKTTKLHVMIQIGGAPLPDVLELARHAEQIKADSLLCLPEIYFKPTDSRRLINYLKCVSDVAPKTPLLYYHIPIMTDVNLHMGRFLETVGTEIPTLVGIKFTSTNVEEAAEAVLADGGRFIVFFGSNQGISAGCAMGMDSFIPTVGNLHPELTLQILEASKKGDLHTARDKQVELTKIVMACCKNGNWLESMKAAMPMLTPINPGPPRIPMCKLPSDRIASLKKDLKTLGLNAK